MREYSIALLLTDILKHKVMGNKLVLNNANIINELIINNIYFSSLDFCLNLQDSYFGSGKYPTLENIQNTKLIRINYLID